MPRMRQYKTRKERILKMGFFSWKTSDTQKSISNKYSDKGALPVYLITPGNEKIYEKEYQGYGVFDGYDAYALLARWNKPEECNGDEEHDRRIGCAIGCTDKKMESLKYPLKFAENPNYRYEDLPPAKNCRHQGYFY